MNISSAYEPRLRLCLLGGCEIQRADSAVRLESVKTIALLVYLALQSAPQPRHKLMGLFWGSQPEANARRNLRHALWNIRQQLDCDGYPSVILSDQQTLAFNHRANAWLDVREFEQSLQSESEITTTAARPDDRYAFLRHAVELYRGDLLDGVYVDDAPAFEEWLLVERERLRACALEALRRLVAYYVSWGEYATGLDYARRLLEMEPWLEEAHRQMMRLLALSGQRTAALAQYETCRRVLAEELNAAPSPETQTLYESIRVSADEIQPARSAPTRNLPLQATPFVGREEELSQLAALLQNPTCRLISLVGPGGIGKTRLAVRSAADANTFSDGIFFVPLAGVGSADLLVSAIADAIGLTFQGDANPQDVLLDYLHAKELLLLMDNFEHLLTGAPLLAEILQAAPRVKILATSRERLNLREEWLMQVGGLEYPIDEERSPNTVTAAVVGHPSSVESFSAVQLFLQGAQRVRLGFVLADDDKPFVTRLCQLVDGMPLAIELAANWARLLVCQEIVARMEQGMDFLTTSYRDLPARHRSMRAVFEQSWQLLSDEERGVFNRLTVFCGGFRQDAAEQVAGANLGLLAALVDKSILKRNPSGRFEVHELLRQYGEEKLSDEEKTRTRELHTRYFAEFLNQREGELKDSRLKEALEKIADEIENVRTGWNWAIQYRSVEMIERSLHVLCRFYELRNLFQEGESMFGRAAERLRQTALDESQRRVLANLFIYQAQFCRHSSRYTKASELLQASLLILQQANSPSKARIAGAVLQLGIMALMVGDYAEAHQHFQSCLATWRELGHINQISAMVNLGYAACQMGQYANAHQLLEEALNRTRSMGHQEGTAFATYYLGLVALGLQNIEKAELYFEQALALYNDLDHAWGRALCLSGLTSVAMQNGECVEATQLAQQGLANAKKIGDAHSTTLCLNALGRATWMLGRDDEAKSYHLQAIQTGWQAQQPPPVLDGLIGLAELDAKAGQLQTACELLAFAIQHPATVARERDRAARLFAALEKQLPPEMITAAMQRTQSLTLEQIIAEIVVGR